MTWKQMQEVVANCEDFCKVYNRKPYFYITGGDPILHPDFWKLLVLLKSKNILFTLMGNPFHLDDEIGRMLKVCGCEKYQMSLDEMRETHDWFRKQGSFDLTLEKIGCLKRAGIKSIIMSTVSKTNRNTENCWKSAMPNIRRTKKQDVKPILIKKTTCGRYMNMKQDNSSCQRMQKKAWCRGCPAVANGTNGDFCGADPQCWKTRNEITGKG